MTCDIIEYGKPSRLYRQILEIVENENEALVYYAKATMLKEGLPKTDGEFNIEDVKVYIEDLRTPVDIEYSKDFVNTMNVRSHINYMLDKAENIKKLDGKWNIPNSKYVKALPEIGEINRLYKPIVGDNVLEIVKRPYGKSTRMFLKVNDGLINDAQKEFDNRKQYLPSNNIDVGTDRNLGDDVSSVLSTISTNDHLLSSIAKNLSNTDFDNVAIKYLTSDQVEQGNSIINLKTSGGYYDSVNKEIVIIKDNIDDRFLEATLLHEIIHSITYDKIRTDSDVSKKWNNLYNEIKNLFEKKGVLTFDESGKGSIYALSNTDEMITGVFTDSNFIKLLQSTPATGKSYKNLWGKVLSFFKNLFNIKDVTLYDEVFALGTQLIEEFNPYEYTFVDNNLDYLPSEASNRKQSETEAKLISTNISSDDTSYTVDGKKLLRNSSFISNEVITSFWNNTTNKFNEEEFFEKLKENNTEEEFKKLKPIYKKRFEESRKIGDDFHKVMEETIEGNNKKSLQVIENKYGLAIKDKIKTIAEDFKAQLDRLYPNHLFLTEQALFIEKDGLTDEIIDHIEKSIDGNFDYKDREALRNFKGIGGRTDLLVISPEGKVTIMDYKFSFKDVADWSSAKSTTIRYQQGVYKKMIQSRGIEVENQYIVPFHIDFDDESGVQDVNIDATVFQSSEPTQNERVNLDRTFKNSFVYEVSNIDLIADITDFERVFFNRSGIAKAKEVKITDEDVDRTLKSFEEKFERGEFFNRYAGQAGRVEKINRENIKEWLYNRKIERISRVSTITKYFRETSNLIKSSPKGEPDISYGFNIPGSDKIRKFLDYYLDDFEVGQDGNIHMSWEIINNDALDTLGIIAFQNKKSGVVDLVSIDDTIAGEEIVENETLLGNFVPRHLKAKALKYVSSAMRPTESNVNAIKAFLYYLNNKNLFDSQGLKLSGVRTIHVSEAKDPIFTIIDTPTLLQNVKGMLRYARDNDIDVFPNLVVDEIKVEDVIPDYQVLIPNYVRHMISRRDKMYLLSENQSKKAKTFVEELEKSTSTTEILDVLKARFNALAEMAEIDTETGFKPETLSKAHRREMAMISEAMLDLLKFSVYNDYDLANKMLTFSENNFTSTPDNIDKQIIQMFIQLQDTANSRIRDKMIVDIQGRLRGNFKSLFNNREKSDYLSNTIGEDSFMWRTIVGDKVPVYKNLEKFEKVTDKEGNVKYKRTMEFRDPDNDSYIEELGQTKLSPNEKQAIINLTSHLNEIRKERGVYSEETKYQIPLLMADANTTLKKKFKEEGLVKSIKGYFDQFVDDVKNIDKVAKGDQQYINRFTKRIEMVDAFQRQDNQNKRNEMLVENNIFEEDLELIIMMYTMNHIRANEYNKILPVINAGRSLMVLKHEGLIHNYPTTGKYLNMMMRTNIYNKKGLSSEDEEATAGFTKLRNITSNLAIGLSPRIGLVNFLTNSWGTLSSLYGINSGKIDKASYFKAMRYVIEDVPKNISNVNALNYMSEYFGIHQMEVTKIINEAREDKKGIINFSRWLHFLNSAPDFLFRMTLFIAEMDTEGIVELKNGKITKDSALQYNSILNKVVYNPEKDKRFLNYFKGDESKEEYWKEKALYEAIREDLKTQYKAVEGDKILRPYTAKQVQGKKKRADLIYQDMSPENRTWFERTSLGVMVMMFKRWILSKKHLYWRETMLDDKLGDYEIIEYKDKNGVTKYIAEWQKAPMEGILQSLVNYAKETVNTKNPIQAWENLEDFQKRNISHGVSDMFIYTIIALLGAVILDKDKDEKEIDQYLFKIVNNSAKDMFILNVLYSATTSNSSIFAIHYTDTIFKTLLNSITRPESTMHIHSKVGLSRDIENIIEGFDISARNPG